MSSNIVVVGSMNMDLVIGCQRFPAPGETLLGGPFATHAGGKGANQAVAAARAGARVSMIAAVGADPYGAQLCDALRAEGVAVDHVVARAGERTGVAVITVDQAGENTIIVAPGANSTLTPADIRDRREAIAAADLCVMQLEVPLESIAAAAAVAREAGGLTVLNAAPARRLPTELLTTIDMLIVNRVEAAQLALDAADAQRAASPEALIDRLLALGVGEVVLTLGRDGAVYSDGRSLYEQPAFPVRAIDSTAAGDAFAGALATARSEGAAPREALRFAAAAGALAVTRAGAQPSLPRRADIERVLRA